MRAMKRSSPSRSTERPRALGHSQVILARTPSALLALTDGRALGRPPATLLHPFRHPAASRSRTSLRLGVLIVPVMGPPNQSACYLPCCGERQTSMTGPTTFFAPRELLSRCRTRETAIVRAASLEVFVPFNACRLAPRCPKPPWLWTIPLRRSRRCPTRVRGPFRTSPPPLRFYAGRMRCGGARRGEVDGCVSRIPVRRAIAVVRCACNSVQRHRSFLRAPSGETGTRSRSERPVTSSASASLNSPVRHRSCTVALPWRGVPLPTQTFAAWSNEWSFPLLVRQRSWGCIDALHRFAPAAGELSFPSARAHVPVRPTARPD